MCCPWSDRNTREIDLNEIDRAFSDCDINGVSTISGRIIIEQPCVKKRTWECEDGEEVIRLSERRASKICNAIESVVETETVAEVLTPVLFAKAKVLKHTASVIDIGQSIDDLTELANNVESTTVRELNNNNNNKTRCTVLVEVHQSCSSPEPDPICPSSPTSSTSEETTATAPVVDTPPKVPSVTNTTVLPPVVTSQEPEQISNKLDTNETTNLILEDEGLGRSSNDGQDIQEVEEHDYEDIYAVRRRDSGSHSRSGSLSSAGSNEVRHQANNGQLTDSTESGVSSPSPSELGNKSESDDNEKSKLEMRHSLPSQQIVNNRPGVKRTASVPPPPPPPPSEETSLTSIPLEPSQNNCTPPQMPLPPVPGQCDINSSSLGVVINNGVDTPSSENESKPNATTKTSSSHDVSSCTSQPQPTFQQQCHNSSTSTQVGHLVNKQMVLPFIPPKFGGGHDPDALIKPSEYLRSLQCASNLNGRCNDDERNSSQEDNSRGGADGCCSAEENIDDTGGGELITSSPSPPDVGITSVNENVEGDRHVPLPPPPPPPPPPHQQPLSAISIQDITSVQLKRTKLPATKTMSCPHPSLTGTVESPFIAVKEDLIAELKMSKDISGIKKLKVERVKQEEKQGKEMASTISKQFTVDYFVDKVPDKDAAGNPIPAWKRQMLAKKAAEKARKEMEEELAREAEAKRLQAIPAWKRHLLQKKQSEEQPNNGIAVTPTPTSGAAKPVQNGLQNGLQNGHVHNGSTIPPPPPPMLETKKNKENNQPPAERKDSVVRQAEDEDNTPIIPWRAQLRKTNSTLNLLE